MELEGSVAAATVELGGSVAEARAVAEVAATAAVGWEEVKWGGRLVVATGAVKGARAAASRVGQMGVVRAKAVA